MKTTHSERTRRAKYARFIRRNERRKTNARRLEESREARRVARAAAGLSIPNPGSPSRVELAPQILIENLRPQLKILLKAFGHPEALVTDESLVGHMLCDGRNLVAIRRRLKIPIGTNDYIFAVAEKLLKKVKRRN